MTRFSPRKRTDPISTPGCAPTQDQDRELSGTTTNLPGIVGIGVSSGGVAAFRQLMGTVPVGCGIAFVVDAGLGKREHAALMDVLGKETALDVSLAADGIRLCESSVHVSPPDAEIGLENGRLRVTRRGVRSRKGGLFDRFFASLALDRGSWAAAIVLEGAGADGLRGLHAIRSAGGFTVGQEAQAEEAPSSLLWRATERGLVDRVLPLDGMLDALTKHFADLTRESAQIRRRLAPVPDSDRATRLEQELSLTKEQLRSVSEQLSTSNEELQSTNEELRIANEELLSSNAELERSREQLQSANDELKVVNAQLLDQVTEATQARNDLANLFASTDIAKILLDPALRISLFTPSATSVFALKPGDKGRPLTEIRMLAEYPRFFEDARAVAAGGPPIETQVRGGQREFMARVSPYRTQGGQTEGVIATFVDVTSLEQARTELRENAEQLRALFEHVAVGIVVTDLEGRLVDVNRAACTMLGWEREVLIGRPFAPQEHPETGRRERKLHADLVLGKRPFYGSEERYVRADGTMLWARGSVSLIRPGGGGAASVVHVLQDVSEARRTETRLRAQESLARLGEMAAAIAHEVRSPLMAVLAAVDILATRIPDGADERRVVGEIRRRIASVDGLVRDLLQFARPSDLRFTRVPLRALLQDAADLLRRSGELGEVTVTLSGEEAEVLGDGALLRSVFLNLANNAAQAMKGKGTLTVDLRVEASACVVSFSDTGPGVPTAIAARIFEPFFTTRSRGIGLGLSLAKRIIEAHGGDIALLPSQGSGTTISVTLPTARA